MATYKKGFKKQNSELLLLKTIVVIIVTVIIIVAAAFIYDSVTKWKNYDNYEAVADYSVVFDMKDESEQAIDDYVVYVYSATCESCGNIKNDVLKLARKLEDDNKFFLLNTGSIEGETDDFLETIEQTQLATPMLVVIKDGEFYELFVGSTSVLTTLESIEDGNYQPFNE